MTKTPDVKLPVGKLPLDLLTRLLGKIETSDTDVVVGPKPGEDAAVIDLGDRCIVAKTDPITFPTDLIGWYMVQVNSNDLAVTGATPRWLLATLLLPEGTTELVVEDIFDQILDACRSLGINLIGGHTEITHDLPRPIAIGALIGEVQKDHLILSSGAQAGDKILLTKGIAIEGTSILAREAYGDLKAAGVSAKCIERAQNLLFSPGISVLQEATIARKTVDIHAMHDLTEGGLMTGLQELAIAGNVGVVVESTSIPILEECKEICRALNLDPMGLISSGSLLATVSKEDSEILIDTLTSQGIKTYDIGYITPAGQGLKLRTPEGITTIPNFKRDELARYFSP